MVTLHELAIGDGSQPLNQSPYYQWLVMREDTLTGREVDAFCDFFDEMKEAHSEIDSDEKTIQYMKYIFEHVWRTIPKIGERDELVDPNDLFILTGGENNFYVSLHNKLKTSEIKTSYFYAELSNKFKKRLNQLNVVYAVKPEHFMFDVTGQQLYLKYQQIIGSRFLCKLDMEKLKDMVDRL